MRQLLCGLDEQAHHGWTKVLVWKSLLFWLKPLASVDQKLASKMSLEPLTVFAVTVMICLAGSWVDNQT